MTLILLRHADVIISLLALLSFLLLLFSPTLYFAAAADAACHADGARCCCYAALHMMLPALYAAYTLSERCASC